MKPYLNIDPGKPTPSGKEDIKNPTIPPAPDDFDDDLKLPKQDTREPYGEPGPKKI
jgi:hypothetical protein